MSTSARLTSEERIARLRASRTTFGLFSSDPPSRSGSTSSAAWPSSSAQPAPPAAPAVPAPAAAAPTQASAIPRQSPPPTPKPTATSTKPTMSTTGAAGTGAAADAGEGPIDVMLSINVRSMGASAAKLKAFLQSSGYSVWVCTDAIGGGAEYRDAIVSAVKRCKVFLPLINDAWASSGECKDEYSFAKRLNLTSHERGLTTPPEPRRPVVLPVAFPDLDWTAYPHVELLAASTNFVVHDGADLASGAADQTFAAVLDALAAAVRPPKGQKARRPSGAPGAKPGGAAKPAEAEGAAAAALTKLAEQLQAVTASLHALQRAGTAGLAAGRGAAGGAGAAPQAAPAEPPEDKRYYEGKLLKERYLGISRFLVNGCYATSAMELVLQKVGEEDAEVRVKGHMLWRKLRCEIVEHDNPRAEPFFIDFSTAAEEQLCERLPPLEEPITGTFIKRNGLLCLQGLGPANPRGERWIYEYRLPISDNGSVLSGVTKGDRGTPPEKQWMNPFRAVAF